MVHYRELFARGEGLPRLVALQPPSVRFEVRFQVRVQQACMCVCVCVCVQYHMHAGPVTVQRPVGRVKHLAKSDL